jgi:hypothetical protein
MSVRQRDEPLRHRARHPKAARRWGWLFAGVLFGEVLGAMVGIAEAPRHTDTVVERVERPGNASDDDDRDPLVTWPLLGMVLGGLGGATAIVLARGVLRVRHRLLRSSATERAESRR